MQVTLTSTDDADRSSTGLGRIWEGTTSRGTPVRALICGMQANSDDPAVRARFNAEYAEMPLAEAHIEIDPDDEEGMTVLRAASVDLWEVVAHWLIAYGEKEGMVPPAGQTAETLAEEMRVEHEKTPNPSLERMLAGAASVTKFIVDKIISAPVVGTAEPGHA